MKYFDRTRDQRLIRWKKAIHSFTFIDPMSPDSRNQPEWANNVTKNCRREEWIVIVQFTKLMVPIQLLRWVTTTWCGVLQTFHQRFIFVFLLRFPFGFIDKNLFYSNAIVSIHRMILLLMIQQRHQVAYNNKGTSTTNNSDWMARMNLRHSFYRSRWSWVGGQTTEFADQVPFLSFELFSSSFHQIYCPFDLSKFIDWSSSMIFCVVALSRWSANHQWMDPKIKKSRLRRCWEKGEL